MPVPLSTIIVSWISVYREWAKTQSLDTLNRPDVVDVFQCSQHDSVDLESYQHLSEWADQRSATGTAVDNHGQS